MKNVTRWFAAVLFSVLVGGCATADRAQLADVATTALAMSQGAVEGNPLMAGFGIGEMAAIKIGLTQAAKFFPEPYCEATLWSLTALGYGAAIWNVGVVLGSGPAALPVAALLIWTQKVHWHETSANTCADPWHFEPIEVDFDWGWGFQDAN
jgi:hypothetical protein